MGILLGSGPLGSGPTGLVFPLCRDFAVPFISHHITEIIRYFSQNEGVMLKVNPWIE